MILSALTLENFKGIQTPVRIALKPITLLFGPNSAGKSSVIQALHYAREILERNNLDPGQTLQGGECMDLGGFDSLVHGHDRDRDIRLTFMLDVTNTDLPTYLTEGDYHMLDSTEVQQFPEDVLSNINKIGLRMVISWSEALNRPIISELAIAANGPKPIAIVRSSPDGRDVKLAWFDQTHPIFYGSSAASHDLFPPSGEQSDQSDIDWDQMFRELEAGMASDTFATDSNSGGEEESQDMFIEEIVEDEPQNWFSELVDDALDYKRFLVGGSIRNLPLEGQVHALPRREGLLNLSRDIWADPTGRYSAFPLAFQTLITSILSAIIVGPLDLLRAELNKKLYIGPLREIPARNHEPPRSPDEGRWASGLAAWDVIHGAEPALLDAINEWLSGKQNLNTDYKLLSHRYRELPLDHEVSLVLEHEGLLDEEDIASKVQRLRDQLQALPVQSKTTLMDMTSGVEVLPHDVGIGISQVLPIVVAAISHQGGMLSVEQPELHIHPALQVTLGDLFAAQLADHEVLYLLETHSEHLLLRLLRRIRETTEGELPEGAPALTPDQVAVYYFHTDAEGVEAKQLRISPEGEFLDRWPKGFFEERAEELF